MMRLLYFLWAATGHLRISRAATGVLVNASTSDEALEPSSLALFQMHSRKQAPAKFHVYSKLPELQSSRHGHSKLRNAIPRDTSRIDEASMLQKKIAGGEDKMSTGDQHLLHKKAAHREEEETSNDKRGQQSPSLLPGKFNQSSLSNCLTASYGWVSVVLLCFAVCLIVCVLRQQQRNTRLLTQVRANFIKLHAERRIIAADQEKLKVLEALKDDEKMLVKAIHNRGNVLYDEGRREFILQKEIVFVPEGSEKGLPKRPVVVRFADPPLAKAILSDFAELLRILKSAVVLVEGHTAGASLYQMGDYEHDVADARAELVKSAIVQLGIPQYRLATLGLPGLMGNGKDDVILKMVN